MIRNGSFTEGWRDLPPALGHLINQEPLGWTLQWLAPGEPLYDDSSSQAKGVPECVHKLDTQLPAGEQRGAPNALILEGDKTYKIFHAGAPFGATLSQTVTGLEPGSEATLSVPIQLHRHDDADPFGAESGAWVNGKGGWASAGQMGDREWYEHRIDFTVPEDGRADVVIRVKSKWERPKDFFIDGVRLEVAAPGTEEQGSTGAAGVVETRAVAIPTAVGAVRLEVARYQDGEWVVQETATLPVEESARLQLHFLGAADDVFSFDVGDGARSARVTAPAGLNVRSGPSINHDILDALEHGTLVTVLGEHGDWFYVETGALTGYASRRWLEVEREAAIPAPVRPRRQPASFFTGIHGPGSPHSWSIGGFEEMMRRLDMPVLCISNDEHARTIKIGDPARNIVRLYYSPDPAKADAETVYQYIRDDQLKKWWQDGYRRFIFFNEPNLPRGEGQSDEGHGIHWHSAGEFAHFLRHCLQRAREDFPGIQLYTTPMTPSFDVWEWRHAMWNQVHGLVDGYAMHAYSGDNADPQNAARQIAEEVTEVKRRLGVQIPIAVTEASVNRGSNAEQKAQVAHLLPGVLAHVPGVEGVFWYAADWDELFDKNDEGWFRKGIGEAFLRQRA